MTRPLDNLLTPTILKKLKAVGIENPLDILFYLPLRYQDKTRIVPIGSLLPSESGVIEGVILYSQIQFAGRRSLNVMIQDSSGLLLLKFFYFNKSQQARLNVGAHIRCFGTVKKWRQQVLMFHPEYRILDPSISTPVETTLTPVYPSLEGFTQFELKKLMQKLLVHLSEAEVEYLPESLRKHYKLPSLLESLHYLHMPPLDASLLSLIEGTHPAKQRLAFEELLAHQLSLQKLKQDAKTSEAPHILFQEKIEQDFLATLPFTLTHAQEKVWQEIKADLKKSHPMMRLVQGDVGSGKTVVAALALLQTIVSGFQAVLMAPTEILARQHAATMETWFAPFGISISFLSGSLKAAPRKKALAEIASGKAQLIIGTHALFQKAVDFHELGLIVIDEQHRFGVAQRQALREKSGHPDRLPHQLIMTATPIPRTLFMTFYANIDLSVIDELPRGRQAIDTLLVNNQRRDEVVQKIDRRCEMGGQVYWVCPLIENNEELNLTATQTSLEYLQTQLPKRRIGLIHGKLNSLDKENAINAFTEKSIDILVATTVIEVGINIPNATLMIIENSERMGLSALHQLRGRVGRGSEKSHCILLYQEPLSDIARKRLQTLKESQDGFYIAAQDLALRGPGEVLGLKQTGLCEFRIADIVRDKMLMPSVEAFAKDLLKNKDDKIIASLIERWVSEKWMFGHV
jgi:ATP-dependent DNA helicase RecG